MASIKRHVHKVPIGQQGRAVIPVELRRELDLRPGEELVAWVEGDRLVFERREALERELWRLFEDVPGSLADELIAERRREARRELGR